MAAIAYELPPHILMTLRGEQALAFLQDICAQEVAGLQPGSGAHAAFLDPKGRVLADAVVLASAEEVLLLAEETCLEGLEQAVSRVASLAGVEVSHRLVAAARVVGGEWRKGLPETEHAWARVDDGIVVRVLWGGDGHDVVAPSFESVRAILAEAGLRSGDPGEAEAARIAAGRPRFGIDVTEDDLVNETPLLEHAVAADKGCYPGQESVARVRNLGAVRRRIVVLDVHGPALAPGSPVERDGVEVGRVTSAAAHGTASVALAVVRSDVASGTSVRGGEIPATVR